MFKFSSKEGLSSGGEEDSVPLLDDENAENFSAEYPTMILYEIKL